MFSRVKGRQVEKLYNREKKECLIYTLIGDCRHEESGGGLTRSGASWVIGLEGMHR